MLNWRDPSNPKAGGAERVTQAYLGALAKRGHEVFWFANTFPGAAASENIDGIEIVRGGGYGSSIQAARKWYCKQPPFDLVIDQHHGIPWFAPWWAKTNVIAYIHEVLGPIWKTFYAWPLSAIGAFQERWTHWFYRNVCFWVPSPSTSTALQKHGVRCIKVIPNGSDTVPLGSLEAKPFGEPLKLVTVSRLAPNKRIDHAIRVVESLETKGIKVEMTIIGRGESQADLEKLVKESNLTNQVKFAGMINESEKNRMLRDAHFLVHTSVREGWGLNVIEANAMGTPAIVYPVQGLVDSTLDGKTGIVTSAEQPEEMATRLRSLLSTPQEYERLRRAAWERSREFEWDQVLPAACEWLEEQARKKPKVSR
jgi:glycosyltransferase involved in cell wall biosynthesis